MNNNLIIDISDSRYGKLGHLWKKYNYSNIWYSEGGRNSYYYIPPELLIENYVFRDGRKITKFPTNDWDNWIHCMKINDFLQRLCLITSQEYFDLLVLHTNSRLDRPRCAYCKSPLYFNNIKVGYGGGGGNSEWITRTSPCCDKSCASHYRKSLGIYDEIWYRVNNDFMIRTKNERLTFINKDEIVKDTYFYITWTSEGLLKFGASSNLYNRICHSYEDSRGYYLNPHIILVSDRIEIANLEATLKLEFQGREYLNPKEIKLLFKLLKRLLAIRPIANPFD